MRIRYLFLLALILLAACGKKGPVRPLETLRPGAPTALELHQQGETLLLGWQLPTQNMDGGGIKQPPLLDIYRLTFDPRDNCLECPDRSILWHSINPEFPDPAQRVGARYQLRDRQLQAGTGYQYKLVPRNAVGENGRAVILRQIFTTPLTAPGQFSAAAQDSSVKLSWQAVSLPPDALLLGYQVYRRQDAGGATPYPINPKPVQQTRFEDFGLQNGSRYHYRVRALIKRGEQQFEGLSTEELAVIPRTGL